MASSPAGSPEEPGPPPTSPSEPDLRMYDLITDADLPHRLLIVKPPDNSDSLIEPTALKFLSDIEYIHKVPASWHEGVILSHVEALHGVWQLAMGLAVVTAIVSLGIREHTLHNTLERK